MLAREPLAFGERVACEGHVFVASSLVSGMRHMLLEHDRWAQVRERLIARDPHAAEWIDARHIGDWYPMERHVAMMGAFQDVVGDEGLRAFGKMRLREALLGGMLAPIFRSWTRSYVSAPSQFLRVTPHAWRAVTRNAGRMSVARNVEREMQLRVIDAPESVRRASAWHRFLEGYTTGLLEAGALEGTVIVTVGSDAIEILLTWN